MVERLALRLVSPRVVVAAALALLLAVAPSCTGGRARPQVPRPKAPTALDGDFADPFVLQVDGTYYAFATGTGPGHVQAARSADLAGWTDLGEALPALPAWASTEPGLTWAPAVLRRGDAYVLYYTTRHAASGFQCISVATSTHPAGPYVDGSPAPLVCQVGDDAPFCGSIDPSPFVDDDGTPYLLWKSDENAAACRTAPRLWSQRLSDDGKTLVGQASVLLARTSPWEGDIIEAPSMIRRDGRYYLFYSANWYASSAYAIGYATCASPTSPCEKLSVSAPLFQSVGPMLGPGGQEVFAASDGALWLAFHAWTAPRTTYEAGGARRLRLARLELSSGAPRVAALP
jgi:beta-xylosidase